MHILNNVYVFAIVNICTQEYMVCARMYACCECAHRYVRVCVWVCVCAFVCFQCMNVWECMGVSVAVPHYYSHCLKVS